MLELIGMVLEHICKTYAEYCLIKIAYTLVFELEVHHQFIGDVEFRTSAKVEAEFFVSKFSPVIPEVCCPFSIS